MKNLFLFAFLAGIAFVLSSCEKNELTINEDSDSLNAQVTIIVQNIQGEPVKNVEVKMLDSAVTQSGSFTVLESENSNDEGKAIFDLESYVNGTSQTFHFAVFRETQTGLELRGQREVQGITQGKQITANLVLLN